MNWKRTSAVAVALSISLAGLTLAQPQVTARRATSACWPTSGDTS